MVNSVQDRLSLNDGIRIPVFGFGTAELNEPEESVLYALKEGYRMVDTSPNYGNEEEVGRGINSALEDGIDRENIFVVTKIEPEDMSFDKAKESVQASLNRLKLDYLDLVLIHSPDKEASVNSDTWKGLEDVLKSGTVKTIGVSNFKRSDLEPLLKEADITPSINQHETHPGSMDWDTKDYCEHNDIVIMAYSPVKKLDGKVKEQLESIAEKHGKSPQQVALRWAMEHNTIPIPRSGNKEHIKQNMDVFDFSLTPNDVESIDRLS